MNPDPDDRLLDVWIVVLALLIAGLLVVALLT